MIHQQLFPPQPLSQPQPLPQPLSQPQPQIRSSRMMIHQQLFPQPLPQFHICLPPCLISALRSCYDIVRASGKICAYSHIFLP